MNHWELLEKFVENNKKVMVEKYISYSQNEIDGADITNWIISFVSEHIEEFNEMIDASFNVGIDNFLGEIKQNIVHKMKRMRQLELKRGMLSEDGILDNMESAFKSAFYRHIRHLYNNISNYKIDNGGATALFFFIRNYAYGGRFSYNEKGDFNESYGGVSYNRKNLVKKLAYLQSEELVSFLKKATIDNLDFEDFFMKNKPQQGDFIFLDQPYDSNFSNYTQNDFTKRDQERLASYLLNVCEAQWMMVIKKTDFIHGLYSRENINISSFNKKYLINFKNKNDKKAVHLIITNY